MMKIKLDEWGTLPTRKHPQDAGLDIYAPKAYTIYPNSTELIMTGVHVELPAGTVGFIKGRSSLNKQGILTDGTVDEGYTGEIGVGLVNTSAKPYSVAKGDRIAQLVVIPILTPDVQVVDELEDTDRGNGGFGSTGK